MAERNLEDLVNTWLRNNEADEDLIQILRNNGFNSKLSLENLNLESPESSSVLSQLNYGQTCFLRGLVRKLQVDSPYSPAVKTANSIAKCSGSLKEKLGKLFHHSTNVAVESPSSSQFRGSSSQFIPSHQSVGSKRKGKGHQIVSSKKKVKQTKIKVIALPEFSNSTPTGVNRDKYTHHMWFSNSASDTEIKQQIMNETGWTSIDDVHYLYAQGRNLRVASLSDVENAECWDLDTLKALMGSGGLYVTCIEDDLSTMEGKSIERETESVESGQEKEDIFIDLIENDVRLIKDEEDKDVKNEIISLASSHSTPTDDSSLGDVVQEMFAHVSRARIDFLLKTVGYMQCVEKILEESQENLIPSLPFNDKIVGTSSSSSDSVFFDSLEDLLSAHRNKIVDEWSEYHLNIDRSSQDIFWSSIISFYKGAISKPQKLYKSFVVSFTNTGEVGSDSGALKKEFFEDALALVAVKLFEGENTNKIPKKDFSLEISFKGAGMLVAHSILNSGPGFPCLSRAVFEYLCHSEVKSYFPVKDDIPLNLATYELMSFIDKLDKATDQEHIDDLLDDATNMAIVNNSRWSIVGAVNRSNKDALLQQLIEEEVIFRREHNLQSFREGLNVLGLVELIQRWPQLTMPLLVHTDRPLTANMFKQLIKSQPPVYDDKEKVQAFKYFLDFIDHIEGEHQLGDFVSLPSLLKFITGMYTIPPIGKVSIEVNYTSNELPTTFACFNTIYLPYKNSKQEFFSAFEVALNFGSGFGKP